MVGHTPVSQYHQHQVVDEVVVLIYRCSQVEFVGPYDDQGLHLLVVSVGIDAPRLQLLDGLAIELRYYAIIVEFLHLQQTLKGLFIVEFGCVEMLQNQLIC